MICFYTDTITYQYMLGLWIYLSIVYEYIVLHRMNTWRRRAGTFSYEISVYNLEKSTPPPRSTMYVRGEHYHALYSL